MALRSEVTGTTGAGGVVVVEGTVVDGGPGGARHYVCDVLLTVDGDQMDWVGPSWPDDNRVQEDYLQIAVLWRDVPIPVHPDPPAVFRFTVRWKADVPGPAVATIAAWDFSDPYVPALTHDTDVIERVQAAAPGGKAGAKPGA